MKKQKYRAPFISGKFLFLKMFAILLFNILLILPFCAYASSLSDEDLKSIHHHLSSQWKAVAYRQPENFSPIFSLHSCLWPALPESYEWRTLEDNNIYLFKHISASFHEFDFVTYPTSSADKVNFLSRWDGITHHSFAYTRTPPLRNDYAREVFPINQDAYKCDGRTYDRGHCIDFADTQGLTNVEMVASDSIDPTISTLDPRNYIPEPPKTHWGRSLRNNLVRDIRNEKGNYAQYVYYPFQSKRTGNGTAIPTGVYFLHLNTNNDGLVQSYHVPWGHAIHDAHAKDEPEWKKRLDLLKDVENFFPFPFCHDLRQEVNHMDFSELPMAYKGGEVPLSPSSYFQLVKAADHEVRNVVGKLFLTHYLLQQDEGHSRIDPWLRRLIQHSSYMDELGLCGFMPQHGVSSLLDVLRQASDVDKEDQLYDHLWQISANQDENDLGLRNIFKEKGEDAYRTPVKIKEEILVHTPEMDMNDYTKISQQMYDRIINFLKQNKKVRLLELTTPRADLIAEHIKANLKEEEKGIVVVEYSTKINKKWNCQPSFFNRGIQARCID